MVIKSLFSRALALLLCVTALTPVVLAAGPAYTVAAMPAGSADPDVLAVLHLDGNLDFAANRDSEFFVSNYSLSFGTSASSAFGGYWDAYRSSSSTLGISSSSGFSGLSAFCLDFRVFLSFGSRSDFAVRTMVHGGQTSADLLYFGQNGNNRFLNSNDDISASSLRSAFSSGWHSVRIIYIDGLVSLFVDGELLCSGTYSGDPISCLYFSNYASYTRIDEIILTTGKYTENLDSYTPATTPFDVPVLPALPASPVENCIYVQTDILPESVQIGGDVPADAAPGVVHVATSPDDTAESIQIYDGSGWVPVSAQIYADSSWHDVIGYPFSASPGDDDPPGDAAHPFLVTPFTDYTVTEGLLLALLLCMVVSAVIKLLKEGFYWLW